MRRPNNSIYLWIKLTLVVIFLVVCLLVEICNGLEGNLLV